MRKKLPAASCHSMLASSLAALAMAVAMLAPRPAEPASACNAPALPITGARILHVCSDAQPERAISNAATGDTIVLVDGAYALTSTLYLNGRHEGHGQPELRQRAIRHLVELAQHHRRPPHDPRHIRQSPDLQRRRPGAARVQRQ